MIDSCRARPFLTFVRLHPGTCTWTCGRNLFPTAVGHCWPSLLALSSVGNDAALMSAHRRDETLAAAGHRRAEVLPHLLESAASRRSMALTAWSAVAWAVSTIRHEEWILRPSTARELMDLSSVQLPPGETPRDHLAEPQALAHARGHVIRARFCDTVGGTRPGWAKAQRAIARGRAHSIISPSAPAL
jgi:hypothetical protein